MKVKFKPEVIKLIEEGCGTWVEVNIGGYEQAYNTHFLKQKFFEIEDSSLQFDSVSYDILNPENLRRYNVMACHIMPYHDFEVTIEDELFEL